MRGVACSLPMNLNCEASFNTGFAGIGCLAAAAAISPNVARRPDACVSTLFSTRTSAAGTFHASAAAATSIARALAPAVRY